MDLLEELERDVEAGAFLPSTLLLLVDSLLHRDNEEFRACHKTLRQFFTIERLNTHGVKPLSRPVILNGDPIVTTLLFVLESLMSPEVVVDRVRSPSPSGASAASSSSSSGGARQATSSPIPAESGSDDVLQAGSMDSTAMLPHLSGWGTELWERFHAPLANIVQAEHSLLELLQWWSTQSSKELRYPRVLKVLDLMEAVACCCAVASSFRQAFLLVQRQPAPSPTPVPSANTQELSPIESPTSGPRTGKRGSDASSASLKALLDIDLDVRSVEGLAKFGLSAALLNAVQNMAGGQNSRHRGPDTYFVFHDTPLFPFIRHGVSAKGYSWSAWVCVDQVRDTNANLFSFLHDTGAGVQCFVHRNRIRVRTLPTCYDTSTIKGFVFRPSRWYHITVTHTPGSRNSKALLSLFVNGALTADNTVEMDYPPIKQQDPVQCTLGGFHGRMSAFYLFNAALSAKTAGYLYSLGPLALSGPDIHEVYQGPVAVFAPSRVPTLAPASPNPPLPARDNARSVLKLLYGLEAPGGIQEVCLPGGWGVGFEHKKQSKHSKNSPSTRAKTAASSRSPSSKTKASSSSARQLVGARSWTCRRDHTAKLTGVNVVVVPDQSSAFLRSTGFPVLFLLLSPRYLGRPFHSDAEVAGIFTLMAQLVLHNPNNHAQLAQLGYPSLRSVFLDHVSTSMRTELLVSAVKRLLLVVHNMDETSEKTHFCLAMEALLQDFTYWYPADVAVQRKVARALGFFINQNAVTGANRLTVRALLDGIRILRPLHFVSGTSAMTPVSATAAASALFDSTHSPTPTSPRTPTVDDNRATDVLVPSALLECVFTLAQLSQFPLVEMESVVSFIEDCRNPQLLGEALNCVLRLGEIMPRQVFGFMHSDAGDYRSFVALLQSDAQPVRLLAIKLLGHFMAIAAKSDRSAAGKSFLQDLSTAIARKLSMFPFTAELYATLLGVLVGRITVDIVGTLDLDDADSFKLPFVLPIILDLAADPGCSPSLREKVLVDLLTMLKLNRKLENLKEFSGRFFWQRHLIAFVGPIPDPSTMNTQRGNSSIKGMTIGARPSSEALNEARYEVINQLVVHIVQTTVWYKLTHAAHGWMALDEVLWALNEIRVHGGRPGQSSLRGDFDYIRHLTINIILHVFHRIFREGIPQIYPPGGHNTKKQVLRALLFERNFLPFFQQVEYELFHSIFSFLHPGTGAGGAPEVALLNPDSDPQDTKGSPLAVNVTAAPKPSQSDDLSPRATKQPGDVDSGLLGVTLPADTRSKSADDAPSSPVAALASSPPLGSPSARAASSSPTSPLLMPHGARAPLSEEIELLQYLLKTVTHSHLFPVANHRQDVLRVIFRFLLYVLPHEACGELFEPTLKATLTVFSKRIIPRPDGNNEDKDYRAVGFALALLKDAMELFAQRQDKERTQTVKEYIHNLYTMWGVKVLGHLDAERLELITQQTSAAPLSSQPSFGDMPDASDDMGAHRTSATSAGSAGLEDLEEEDEEDHQDHHSEDEKDNDKPTSAKQADEAKTSSPVQPKRSKRKSVLSYLGFKSGPKTTSTAPSKPASAASSSSSGDSKEMSAKPSPEDVDQTVFLLYQTKLGADLARVFSAHERKFASTVHNRKAKIDQSVRSYENSVNKKEVDRERKFAATLQHRKASTVTRQSKEHSRLLRLSLALNKQKKKKKKSSAVAAAGNDVFESDALRRQMRKCHKEYITKFPGRQQQFWKLDSTENPARMRLVLRTNLDGSTYPEASSTKSSKQKAAAKNVEELPGVTLKVKPLPGDADDADADEKDSEQKGPEEETKQLVGGLDWTDADAASALGDEEDDEEEEEADDAKAQSRVLRTAECMLVTTTRNYKGTFTMTKRYASFQGVEIEEDENGMPVEFKDPADDAATDRAPLKTKYYKWSYRSVRQVLPRKYQLRENAMELFMRNLTNYFVVFDKKERNPIYRQLCTILRIPVEFSPANRIYYSGLTKRWQNWEISTFEYLMHLNTIAGRSYNDLTQYPVFPWVLTDYKSPTIDLDDPSVYRDLSKPIGALNDERWEIFQERFEGFQDDTIPPFHYGSHYSSAGIALHYLLRMEPFAGLAIKLQGGRFDLADRLFSSIAQAWDLSFNNVSDVKELIPEFFYMPDFLRNANGFDLGVKQGSGARVGDVILPPWASSPEEFVRINREALESDYVSEHIHEWIDLIFGYKQQGPAALEARNVFFYLTYAGNVDIDSIEDEATRKATEAQIAHFGQTPSQLFTTAHPKRHRRKDCKQSHITLPAKSSTDRTGDCWLVHDYGWETKARSSDDTGPTVAVTAAVGSDSASPTDKSAAPRRLPKRRIAPRAIHLGDDGLVVAVRDEMTLRFHDVSGLFAVVRSHAGASQEPSAATTAPAATSSHATDAAPPSGDPAGDTSEPATTDTTAAGAESNDVAKGSGDLLDMGALERALSAAEANASDNAQPSASVQMSSPATTRPAQSAKDDAKAPVSVFDDLLKDMAPNDAQPAQDDVFADLSLGQTAELYGSGASSTAPAGSAPGGDDAALPAAPSSGGGGAHQQQPTEAVKKDSGRDTDLLGAQPQSVSVSSSNRNQRDNPEMEVGGLAGQTQTPEELKVYTAARADGLDLLTAAPELALPRHNNPFRPPTFVPTTSRSVLQHVQTSQPVRLMCPHWFAALPQSLAVDTQRTQQPPVSSAGSGSPAPSCGTVASLSPVKGTDRARSQAPQAQQLGKVSLRTGLVSCISPNGKFLITGGYSDNTLKCHLLTTMNGKPLTKEQPLSSVVQHRSPITAIGISRESSFLVSGSLDGEVMVWFVNGKRHEWGRPPLGGAVAPASSFSVHRGCVIDVAIDTYGGLACSIAKSSSLPGSFCNDVAIYSTRRGRYVRSIAMSPFVDLRLVAVSKWSRIALFGVENGVPMLYVYTMSGFLVCAMRTHEYLSVLRFTSSGDFIVTGGSAGVITFRHPHNLHAVQSFGAVSSHVSHGSEPAAWLGGVCSVALSPNEQYFAAGYEGGKLFLFHLPNSAQPESVLDWYKSAATTTLSTVKDTLYGTLDETKELAKYTVGKGKDIIMDAPSQVAGGIQKAKTGLLTVVSGLSRRLFGKKKDRPAP